MQFIPHEPAELLRPFVQHFWWSESPPGVRVEGAQFPEGGVVVMFSHGGPQGLREPAGRMDWYRTRWASGERTRPFHLLAPEGGRLLGIHFRPGGAFPFFDLPLSELADRVVGLDLLWPEAERLHEAVALASSPEVRFGILERHLEARLERGAVAPCGAVHESMRLLAGEPAGTPVRSIAARMGFGERHLRRYFDLHVGLGPKSLHRVLRFQSVIARLDRGTGAPAWPALALDCGYFDQAHLIRDFRGFTGLTPTAYLRTRSVDPNFAGAMSDSSNPGPGA
jgi:AraC-like DNA-binding protein